ncbi:hypothetical protein TNIN_220251 [Trichonephila inaurata madagascariensis]|uniref:Uncharacterized protein n=1 Tax=Trichonephila inaurata madagascariensis TaxID=2747483 RepID=A0A8X7CGH7_9ARAC|nr:hypothetical protein TNIN_220251 [Trichonephila inaurata madagascariensis]
MRRQHPKERASALLRNCFNQPVTKDGSIKLPINDKPPRSALSLLFAFHITLVSEDIAQSYLDTFPQTDDARQSFAHKRKKVSTAGRNKQTSNSTPDLLKECDHLFSCKKSTHFLQWRLLLFLFFSNIAFI